MGEEVEEAECVPIWHSVVYLALGLLLGRKKRL